MTELLCRVIAELEKLPDDQQDAIAARLLAELKDEQAWATRFEFTTNDTVGSIGCYGTARHRKW